MIVNPPNLFWNEITLPEDLMNHVWSQIKLAKTYQTSAKHKLAGHVTSSLELQDANNKLGNYLLENSKELTYAYHPNLQVRDLWVNFQNKYEFNPLHHHNGALSFVIWVQIPYKYEDECNHITTKDVQTIQPVSGCFQFRITLIDGTQVSYNYPLDTSFNGKCIIFPSNLYHQVYPFYTSDLERISISGNIY